MEILALASQHHHPHWHGHCKKIVFVFRIFFLKNRIFMLFLVLSYGINTTLLQILISLGFPIHPLKDVYWCSRKRLFEHSEVSVHWCFKKTTAPKASPYFAYFPEKHPGWSSFQVHSQAFLGLLLKALQSIYSADRDLSEQFRCPLFGTKNSIFQLSFETQS